MEEVIKTIKELKNTASIKAKKEILEQNKDNQMLKDILYFVYNPYIVTGLSNKKINKDISEKKIVVLPADNEKSDITCIFDYLIEHNTGRDEDIAYVQNYLTLVPVEDKEIYERIFTKNLKLGIKAKVINQVWKNFIPEFNVMLAEKYADRKQELLKRKPEIIITQKLDGVRAVAIVKENNVKILSRQGVQITGLIEIENELRKLQDGCYDGELLLDNPNNLSSKDLYRQTVSIVNSNISNKTNIILNVFDYVSCKDFIAGGSEIPCTFRKIKAYELLKEFDLKYIKPVPILYQGKYDTQIIKKELDKQIELEHEGIMINIANAPYQATRTKNLLKVKAMQDCDLKIIGFEEGTGKNKGTLGAIIVDYKGFKVKVGSGFTDEDREYFWNNQNELIGRIITVQYFEETTNKKDNSLSLRFPVYRELREEDKEVSYY